MVDILVIEGRIAAGKTFILVRSPGSKGSKVSWGHDPS